MAEALRQYWYLGIALIATVILTLWVIKKGGAGIEQGARRTRGADEKARI